jgi:phage tail protein X
MPRLSVWMLRGALAALLAGSLPGGWLLSLEPGLDRLSPGFREAHIVLMLFGWLAPFVLGVAYWMLPRYPTAPERGQPALGWMVYGMYQTGLLLAVAGALAASPGLASRGQLLLAAAGLSFLMLLWNRVRPFGAR